jgi:hypothetical protein
MLFRSWNIACMCIWGGPGGGEGDDGIENMSIALASGRRRRARPRPTRHFFTRSDNIVTVVRRAPPTGSRAVSSAPASACRPFRSASEAQSTRPTTRSTP